MDWSDILFKFITLALTVLGGIITYYVIPYIKSKTTSEQRKDLVYWMQLAIKVAEDMYNKNGQGELKKKYVIDWLNQQGIKFTDEQLSLLIDMIVKYFNTQGWDKSFIE